MEISLTYQGKDESGAVPSRTWMTAMANRCGCLQTIFSIDHKTKIEYSDLLSVIAIQQVRT